MSSAPVAAFPSVALRSNLPQLADLERALETDRVLCRPQLKRYFPGLTFSRLPKSFKRFSMTVRPICNGVASETSLDFVALSPLYQRLSAERIAHLAGTAEMRYKLSVSLELWTNFVQGMKRSAGRPDAMFETAEGVVAVEYDSGSYSAATVRGKLAGYASFGSIVWGASGKVRTQHLRALHGSAAVFLHLPWWSS